MNKYLLHGIVVLAVMISLSAFAYGNTYYVDFSGGNDGNTGLSPLTPWKTLTKVNGITFQSGDTILFKGGQVWTGQLKPKGSGSAVGPIVIDMYSGPTKPLIAGGGVTGQATLYLNNQQYWEINNLEITNDAATAGDRRGVLIAASNFGIVHHVYLRNLDIHDVKGIVGQDDAAKRTAGIGIETTNDGSVATRYDDVRIEGCVIYGIENTGIYTDNLISRSDYPRSEAWMNRRFTNVLIRNNVIHDIAKNAMIIRLFDKGVIEHNVCYETAQQTTGNTMFTASCDSTVFQYNEGYLNRSTGADGSMYDADLRSPRTIWQYSYSHDNAHGLFWTCTVQADSGVVCRYNVSQNDRGIIFCINYPNTSVYCYNNTVYCPPAESPVIISERNVNSGTRKYYFYNNIIYNSSTSASYDFRTSGYTRIIDYNVYYGNHPSGEPNDPHKLTSNPLLVNPGSGGIGLGSVLGYQLLPASPCINSGITVPGHSDLDYLGNAVPFGPAVDRGAFERENSIPTYALTLLGSNGTVSKTPDEALYDSGAAVILSATPAGGYRFDSWSGDLSGSQNPDTVIMNAGKTITANFLFNSSTTFITWTGAAGNGLWSSAANWSSGLVPASGDTVILDHSNVLADYSISITSAGSVCRRLIVGGGVMLQINGAAATLTVGDGLAGNNDIQIQNGGEIHNLSTASSGVTPFALADNTVDRFRIENGGLYIHNTPRGFSTPFPVAACSFDVASTVEFGASAPAQPPMAGREYGNLVFSSTARKTLSVNSSSAGLTINGTMTISGDSLSFIARWTAASPIVINSIVHNGDTISFSSSTSPISIGSITNNNLITGTTATSPVTIRGNIVNNGEFTVGSGQTVILQGSSQQSISGSGSMLFPSGLTIDNPAGITASTNVNVTGGTLTFTSGNIILSNGYFVSLSPGVSTSRVSGHVVGKFRKAVPAGQSSLGFEIGDPANYTPVTISFDTVTTGGAVIVSTTNGSHPLIESSGLDSSRKLNRYYSLVNEGIAFNHYDITLHFVASDLDGEANPMSFVVKKLSSGVWTDPVASIPQATSIQGAGLMSMGDFAAGETSSTATYTLSLLVSGSGVVTKNPDRTTYASGVPVELTASPSPGHHFVEWAGNLVGTDNPATITMDGNKSITAIFDPDPVAVTVQARWNLISLPVSPSDRQVSVLFPTATSPAFAYDGAYSTSDTMANGVGYWLKFAGPETVSVAGDLYPRDSLSLQPGWNLIGSVGTAVAVGDVRESIPGMIASPFYGFENSYVMPDSIYPGGAYWIKANVAGKIFLNIPASKSTNLLESR